MQKRDDGYIGIIGLKMELTGKRKRELKWRFINMLTAGIQAKGVTEGDTGYLSVTRSSGVKDAPFWLEAERR